MRWKYKIITLILACSLLLPTCVYAKELQIQDNVATDKSWSIKFSIPIDTKTLDKNINITDSTGNLIDTTLNVTDNNKVVTVIPKKTYIPNETYTLNVNQNVKSVKGKSIGENLIKKFTVSNMYSINTENEKIIKEFRSHHGYTNDELKNMKIKYLGNVEGYFIYYVPLKESADYGSSMQSYEAGGYVFPAVSMSRIIGIKDSKLYTLGNLIFETSLKDHAGEVYNLLIDEFKDLNKIPYEI